MSTNQKHMTTDDFITSFENLEKSLPYTLSYLTKVFQRENLYHMEKMKQDKLYLGKISVYFSTTILIIFQNIFTI